MACPSASTHEVHDDGATVSSLLAVNHKQQLFLRATTCTCQHTHPQSPTMYCAVTRSLRLNLSLSDVYIRPFPSLHLIFRLLPAYVTVHRDAEGYDFVLNDRWASQSVTEYLLNIWKKEVTGAADVPTLRAMPFRWYMRAGCIVLRIYKHNTPWAAP